MQYDGSTYTHYTKKLEKRAGAIVFGVVLRWIIFALGAALLLSKFNSQIDLVPTALLFVVVALIVGLVSGENKALQTRCEVQRMLCMQAQLDELRRDG